MITELMPDIESFEEFEQKVLEAFAEISPVPFEDAHLLVQEYARIITGLRDGTENCVEEANEFNKRYSEFIARIKENGREETNRLPSNSMRLLDGHPYKKFEDWILFTTHFQGSAEYSKETGGRSVGLNLVHLMFGPLITGEYLVNQIVDEKLDMDSLTYRLIFFDGFLHYSNSSRGIRFPRPNYEKMPVEQEQWWILQDRLKFPEGGLIKMAHIM